MSSRDELEQVQTRFADAIRRYGTAAVARATGMSREAALAIAGGFPCQRGTQSLAIARVGDLPKDKPPAAA